MLKRLLLVGAALALLIPAQAQAATLTASAHFEGSIFVVEAEETGLQPFEFSGAVVEIGRTEAVGACVNRAGNFVSGRGFTDTQVSSAGTGNGGFADSTGVAHLLIVLHSDHAFEPSQGLPKCRAKGWPFNLRSLRYNEIRVFDPLHGLSVDLPDQQV